MDDETERVKAVYDRYGRSARRAKAWSAANPGNRLIREEIVAAVAAGVGDLAAPAGDVLDIGCGSGWWLRRLVELGVSQRRLHGADLLETRVQAARSALPGADLRCADARELPWPDDHFWLATMFLVLSSEDGKESQMRSLAEARRVLRPGGHLFVWEPRVPNPANRATGPVRLGTVKQVFEEVSAEPVTVLPFLVRRLGRRPRAHRLLVRSRLLRTHRLMHARLR
jgi:ubiquinone/menaquinone biosynthesis C-methylase UbiE